MLPGAALAHPHVWMTGGADFGVDADDRLNRVRIPRIYDALASLHLLGTKGPYADGGRVLSDEDKTRIPADQADWAEEFDGDS